MKIKQINYDTYKANGYTIRREGKKGDSKAKFRVKELKLTFDRLGEAVEHVSTLKTFVNIKGNKPHPSGAGNLFATRADIKFTQTQIF